MDDKINRERLQQQDDELRRRQRDQQQRQADREDELNRARTNPLDDGLEGGVDTGAIQPGKTGL